MKIRYAEVFDAERITEIDVNGWQCAYGGLLPADFLALRGYSEERVKRWRERLQKHDDIVLVAEDENGRVIGFVWGGKGRDKRIDRPVELYAFYVDPAEQGKEYGRALFEVFAKEAGADFYLFMLEGNAKAARFYEKNGCVLQAARAKTEAIGGTIIREVCYFYDVK